MINLGFRVMFNSVTLSVLATTKQSYNQTKSLNSDQTPSNMATIRMKAVCMLQYCTLFNLLNIRFRFRCSSDPFPILKLCHYFHFVLRILRVLYIVWSL